VILASLLGTIETANALLPAHVRACSPLVWIALQDADSDSDHEYSGGHKKAWHNKRSLFAAMEELAKLAASEDQAP
jgi:hypothetical protein